MFKELILAIILGGLLGFGVTGSYFALKKNTPSVAANLSPTPEISPDTSSSPTPINSNQITPAATDNHTHSLNISSPENESIVSKSKIEITGSTTPKSLLIVKSPINSFTAIANDQGDFSVTVDIDSGPNLITIDSIDPSDNLLSQPILITYSTATI